VAGELTDQDLLKFGDGFGALADRWRAAFAPGTTPKPEELTAIWEQSHQLYARLQKQREDRSVAPEAAQRADVLAHEIYLFMARTTCEIAVQFAQSPGLVLPIRSTTLSWQEREHAETDPGWWMQRGAIELEPLTNEPGWGPRATAEWASANIRFGLALEARQHPAAAEYLTEQHITDLAHALHQLRVTPGATIERTWLDIEALMLQRSGRQLEAQAVGVEAQAVTEGVDSREAVVTTLREWARWAAQEFEAYPDAQPSLDPTHLEYALARVQAVDVSIQLLAVLANQAEAARRHDYATDALAIAAARSAEVAGRLGEQPMAGPLRPGEGADGPSHLTNAHRFAARAWEFGQGERAADAIVHAAAMLTDDQRAWFLNQFLDAWVRDPDARTSLINADVASVRSLAERLIDGGDIDMALVFVDLARDQMAARRGITPEHAALEALAVDDGLPEHHPHKQVIPAHAQLAQDMRARALRHMATSPDFESWYRNRESAILFNRATTLPTGSQAREELCKAAAREAERAVDLSLVAKRTARAVHAMALAGEVQAELGDHKGAESVRHAALELAGHLFGLPDDHEAWGSRDNPYTRDEIIEIANDLRDAVGLDFDPDLGRPPLPHVEVTKHPGVSRVASTERVEAITPPPAPEVSTWLWADAPDLTPPAPTPTPPVEPARPPVSTPTVPQFAHQDATRPTPPAPGGLGF